MEEEIAVLQKLYNTVVEFLVTYSFQILGAIIILIVGIKLAGWVARLVERLCEKYELDVTLTKFLAGVVKTIVWMFVFIVAIGKFGISIAPFVAAIGALAFGGSFAIQGPLSNYGAGLAIILSRPFVVGNTITVKGVSGVVDEIRLAATVLSTEDGEEITIPNKHIVGEIIHNSFAERVVEASVGISYGDDPDKAISILRETLTKIPEVRQGDRPPQVGIEAFADSAISIGLRYWVPTKKYFQTLYQVNLAIHRALLEGGVTIPFPQRDVHMVSVADDDRNKATT